MRCDRSAPCSPRRCRAWPTTSTSCPTSRRHETRALAVARLVGRRARLARRGRRASRRRQLVQRRVALVEFELAVVEQLELALLELRLVALERPLRRLRFERPRSHRLLAVDRRRRVRLRGLRPRRARARRRDEAAGRAPQLERGYRR